MHTNHENIKSILEMGVGSAHDIDFVMRAKWIGVGNTPISKQEQPQVLDQQIENILAHKPAFLEELNPSPSMEFDNSRNLKSDNENDSFVSPHNLSFVNIDVYPSSMNSEPLLTVTSKDSSGSFNNSINKQDAEIIREKSSDSFLHVSKSNTDSTISKLDKSDSISRSILSKDSSFKISRVDDKIPVKPDVSRVDSMRRLKQSNSFKESSGAKPNFRFMEDYLDEIMKDDGNTEKIEFLENCFKKSEDVPKTSESIEYNDSGLSTILRRKSKGSRSSIHSPISRNDSNELKLSRGSYSKSNRASPVKISILAMFDGLEQEIDKIERNDQIINVEQAEGAVSRSEKNLEILVNQAVEVLKLN